MSKKVELKIQKAFQLIGEALTIDERGEWVKMLKKEGWSEKKIAEKRKLSRTTIHKSSN